VRGGGRSRGQTCLCIQIPCQQGKEQGILPIPGFGSRPSGLLAREINSFLPNSLRIRTGTFLGDIRDRDWQNTELLSGAGAF
jgi:hypothetical protein